MLSHASPEWGQALETLNQLGQAQGLGASSLAIQQQPVRAWSRLQVEPQGQNLAVTAAVAGLETNLTDQLQVLAGSAQTLNQVLSRQAESAPAPPPGGQSGTVLAHPWRPTCMGTGPGYRKGCPDRPGSNW